MLTFLDGPANPGGNRLLIKRTPHLLRVTRNRKGVFDALDQVKDFAKPDEELFAYRLVSVDGHAHYRGKVSGCFAIATYRFVDPQPDQETLRCNMTWRAWCLAQVKEGKSIE